MNAKDECRSTTNNARKNGEIRYRETCDHCGGSDNLHMHHVTYLNPFMVQTLCADCHSEVHRRMTRTWKRSRQCSEIPAIRTTFIFPPAVKAKIAETMAATNLQSMTAVIIMAITDYHTKVTKGTK